MHDYEAAANIKDKLVGLAHMEGVDITVLFSPLSYFKLGSAFFLCPIKLHAIESSIDPVSFSQIQCNV